MKELIEKMKEIYETDGFVNWSSRQTLKAVIQAIESYSLWHKAEEKPTEEGAYILSRWMGNFWASYTVKSLSDAIDFMDSTGPWRWQLIILPDPPKEDQ